jgi:hypothetical protein
MGLADHLTREAAPKMQRIAAVDSLKALDPKRPIREATRKRTQLYVGSVPIVLQKSFCTVDRKVLGPPTRLSSKHVRGLIAQ